jgi:phosphoglycerate dehydrogenase-like enzyme
MTATATATAEVRRLKEAGVDVVLGPAGRLPLAEELPALLEGCVAWIAGVETVSAAVLEAAPDLRLISRNGSGIDNIDIDAAARLGIEVRAAVGANAGGVAELAVCLILSGLRLVPWHARTLADGGWDRQGGRELSSATVGVVGVGAIGSRVARLVAAFGATVLAYDRYPPAADNPPYGLVELDELIRRSDVVTLHVPASPDDPLLGANRIAALSKGAVLVNTARWSLVDPDAVLDALEGGHLRTYAVDAFATEPPAPHPLLRHPRVIATPHLGAFTTESARRAADASVDNVLDYLGAHGLT